MATAAVAQVARDVTLGEGVKIVHPANLYGCIIGHDCFIGPFTEIQRGVVVGAHSRIQSHSFLCSGVTLGEHCFVGHGVMFINDRLGNGAPQFDPAHWQRTHIGHGVCIGSNATLLPVTICDHAVIGAGAVVTRDITQPGTYAGNPAQLLRPF